MTLLIVGLAILLVNLPFGFWRGGVAKFSPAWFAAVHVPVPIVVGIRLAAGVHWHLTTVPVLVGGYFGGQLVGARMRRARSSGVLEDERVAVADDDVGDAAQESYDGSAQPGIISDH